MVPVAGRRLPGPGIRSAGGQWCPRLPTPTSTACRSPKFVMRSVLEEFQDVAQWRRQALERRWRIHDWREVSGSTWLIIGLGGIGTVVGASSTSFRRAGDRESPAPIGD